MKKAHLEQLFVVTVVSNICRYKSRYRLFKRFRKMCEHAGVQLIVVELGFGDRDFEVTKKTNPHHLQVRSVEEFWHKENLINLGIAHGRRQFPKAKMVAWIDADCRPARMPKNWFEETWHQLQHYKFVQMWEHMQPLDLNYSPVCAPNVSFMFNYLKYGTPYPKPTTGYPNTWGSPGLAWAANLEDLDAIGGIPDVAILGAGDWYLAHMLISDSTIHDMAKSNYSEGYKDYWAHKQNLCTRHIKRDVGCVPGLVYHDYHGRTVDRGYNTREHILIKYQFDPRYDLKRDHQGVYQLETEELRQILMYQDIRSYFRKRNEDSTPA